MVKYIALWVIKPGLDPEKTWSRWREEHVEWVKKRLHPELKRYVQNRIIEELPGSKVDWFGITELYFDDVESARRAIEKMITPPLDQFMVDCAIPAKVRRVFAEEIEVEL